MAEQVSTDETRHVYVGAKDLVWGKERYKRRPPSREAGKITNEKGAI